MAIATKLKKNKLIYLVIIALYLTWQMLSSPDIFFSGRYFAEEGSYWYSHALANNFFKHMYFVPPLSGYFLFNANLQTGVAVLLPFEFGPIFTAWSSLALMVLPAILLYKFCVQANLAQIKPLLLSILLFAPYINKSETFANSINSQVYLGLSTFIIFLFFPNIKSRTSKFLTWFLLLIAFLSGYYSVILLPMLIYRLVKEGSSPFGLKVITLGLFSLILQICITLNMKMNAQLWPTKLEIDRFSYDFFVEFWLWVSGSFLLGYASISLFFIALIMTFALLLIPTSTTMRLIINQMILAFFFQGLLIFFGSAEFSVRYLALFLTILLFIFGVSFNQFFQYFTTSYKYELIIYTMVFIIMFSSIFIRDYSDDLLVCSSNCISFQEQSSNIEIGETQYLVHWPMHGDSRDWFTNIKNPKVTLAPFQEIAMNVR